MQPQEVEVWFILPTIRKELALALIKNGLTQKESANLLKITEAAISQYVNKKRASNLRLNKNILVKIDNSAKKIIKNKMLVMNEIQHISRLIRENKILCKVHKKYDKTIKRCNICLAK